MRHRTTAVLMLLFFAGLAALWYADFARVPTRRERQVLANRLLPELIDVPAGDVDLVEIDHGPSGEKVVLERRAGGRWQITRPIDAAADPEPVETLIRNLKDLGKSVDSGTIEEDPEKYGLAPPAATVRLRVKGRDERVTLDIGRELKLQLYVRPGGESGAEVIDPRLVSAVGQPSAWWRDTFLFRMPSFRVEAVTVAESDPKHETTARRADRHWRLTHPVAAPADDDKVEGLVATLTGLRVVKPDASEEGGFVADNVRDLARYGLDAPARTVTITPFPGAGAPQTVLFGKPVPGKPDQVYAVRGDQDDVVRVDLKQLREAIPSPNALRSQQVLDFAPARATRLRIKTSDRTFEIARTPAGWENLSPTRGKADATAVQSLLTKLAELKVSDFFEPTQVADPRLDSPRTRIQIWQSSPGSSEPLSSSSEPAGDPRIDLSLGRDDRLKKTVYGRLHGDSAILAVPEESLRDLPRNNFAFLDRTVLDIKPERFARVTVERPGFKVTVVPNGLDGKGLKSRMVEPVDAPADDAAVTSLLLALGNLRAETWESDSIGDPSRFGLDAPWLRVKWALQTDPTTPRTKEKNQEKAPTPAPVPGGGTLRVGKLRPGSVAFYANVEGDPRVFALSGGVVSSFDAEMHDKTVFAFRPETADRVTLSWPGRSLALRGEPRTNAVASWTPEPVFDPSGFDPSRVAPLVALLSDLKTSRYLQYDGPIGPEAGLNPPRLTVQVRHGPDHKLASLRVGNARPDGACLATTSSDTEGAVFLLVPADPFPSLLKPPHRAGDLPDDPFAPAPPSLNPVSGKAERRGS